jgi:hypothetical protein
MHAESDLLCTGQCLVGDSLHLPAQQDMYKIKAKNLDAAQTSAVQQKK